MLSDLQGEICDSQWLPISLVLYGEFAFFICHVGGNLAWLSLTQCLPLWHTVGYPVEHKPHISTGHDLWGPMLGKNMGPFFQNHQEFQDNDSRASNPAWGPVWRHWLHTHEAVPAPNWYSVPWSCWRRIQNKVIHSSERHLHWKSHFWAKSSLQVVSPKSRLGSCLVVMELRVRVLSLQLWGMSSLTLIDQQLPFFLLLLFAMTPHDFYSPNPSIGLCWWLSGKESTCQCKRRRFDRWVRKIPWRRAWQPT